VAPGAPKRLGDGDVVSVARRRAARGSGGAALGMRGLVPDGPGTALAASSRRSIAASESPVRGAAVGMVAEVGPTGTVLAGC
jgi:hypothetical protein